MRILGVFRDIVPARIGCLLFEVAQEQGVNFLVVAEGKAVSMFKEAGIPLLVEGTDSHTPFIKAPELMRETAPDIVCVGASCPINWELEFAIAAKELQIPVVVCEDIWGAMGRFGNFLPETVLVIDNFAADMLSQRGVRPRIIGDIASETNVNCHEDAGLARYETLRSAYASSVLIVGDHVDVVTELVALSADCVREEPDPNSFVIIPRLVHPKQVNDPVNQVVLRKAKELLRGFNTDPCEGISTDALAARCDYTVCAYSTPLRIAVHHGRRGISVHASRSQALLKKETGFDQFPLVTQGVVPAVHEPVPFSAFDWEFFKERARVWAESTRFNPRAALEELRVIAEE